MIYNKDGKLKLKYRIEKAEHDDRYSKLIITCKDVVIINMYLRISYHEAISYSVSTTVPNYNVNYGNIQLLLGSMGVINHTNALAISNLITNTSLIRFCDLAGIKSNVIKDYHEDVLMVSSEYILPNINNGKNIEYIDYVGIPKELKIGDNVLFGEYTVIKNRLNKDTLTLTYTSDNGIKVKYPGIVSLLSPDPLFVDLLPDNTLDYSVYLSLEAMIKNNILKIPFIFKHIKTIRHKNIEYEIQWDDNYGFFKVIMLNNFSYINTAFKGKTVMTGVISESDWNNIENDEEYDLNILLDVNTSKDAFYGNLPLFDFYTPTIDGSKKLTTIELAAAILGQEYADNNYTNLESAYFSYDDEEKEIVVDVFINKDLPISCTEFKYVGPTDEQG